eukprot:scpid95239/ scgid32344/ 
MMSWPTHRSLSVLRSVGGDEHTQQVGVNADEATASAAEITDPAACLEDCWPPADRVGNTSWCECGKCVVQALQNNCTCCEDIPESATIGKSGRITCTPQFDVFPLP